MIDAWRWRPLPGDREALDSFVSLVAGTVSPVEFFDPAHVASITGAAATA
jgi:hypothetical protein